MNMLRTALLLVSCGLLAACQHAPVNRGGPADALLASYRVKLEATLAQQGAPDMPHLLAAAYTVTKAELLPYRPLLHQQAIYLLGQLEFHPRPTTTGYRSLLREEDRELLAAFFDRQSLMALLSSPEVRTDELWALLVSCWNPLRIAGTLPALLEARAYGPAEVGRRALIRSLAPQSMYRTSDDWRSPVLVMEGGRELIIVTMTYDEHLMIYLPQQLEWYAKP
jgi:hypothetical protein